MSQCQRHDLQSRDNKLVANFIQTAAQLSNEGKRVHHACNIYSTSYTNHRRKLPWALARRYHRIAG